MLIKEKEERRLMSWEVRFYLELVLNELNESCEVMDVVFFGDC